jgi:hypothetical protein
MELNEDYTAGVLKGIPIFAINRKYMSVAFPTTIVSMRYVVTLKNRIEVSIIQFIDKAFSGGLDYEMLVVEANGIFIDSEKIYDVNDVYRGSAKDIHNILSKLEVL